MKQVEAVIRKERFPEVDAALKEIGVGGLTVTEARGRGRSTRTVTSFARGKWVYNTEYLHRIVISVVVDDEDVKSVVDSIVASASTKSLGDGKVFVFPIESAVDIGSGDIDGSVLDAKAPMRSRSRS